MKMTPKDKVRHDVTVAQEDGVEESGTTEEVQTEQELLALTYKKVCAIIRTYDGSEGDYEAMEVISCGWLW